jgi:hypothetical protein
MARYQMCGGTTAFFGEDVQINAVSHDCAMLYGEADHGRRFSNSRGCAEAS